MKYAIIDIETTGLNPRRDRITEVAIIVHDGARVVDEFISLVNPEVRIPYRIRELTGISDTMVSMAPRFCEIARQLVEITEGCIFIAHNVNFDYNFIREEFARLGYRYERQTLCTKKLSQKLIPCQRSYSLGNLCKALDIRIEHRHRAFGDARATVKLFELLLRIEHHPESISTRGIRTYISEEKLASLPGETGVYYMYNQEGSIIYIGKSKNIKERVLSHLSNQSTKRASEMKDQVFDVGYELCGSELIALLRESEEIKEHMPRFNRLLRRRTLQWGLYLSYSPTGYMLLEIKRNKGEDTPLTTFTSKRSGTEFLFALIETYRLCQKLCGLYKTNGTCFQYQIEQCNGACIGEESPEEYNARVKKSIEPYCFIHDSFVILDKGRGVDEKSVVLVENHRYCGYGFIPVSEAILDPNQLKLFIKPKPDHRDAQQIIRTYLKQGKPEIIIRIHKTDVY